MNYEDEAEVIANNSDDENINNDNHDFSLNVMKKFTIDSSILLVYVQKRMKKRMEKNNDQNEDEIKMMVANNKVLIAAITMTINE